MFRRKDGTVDDFSIKKCVSNLPSVRGNYPESGINRFKKITIEYPDKRCNYCNCTVGVGDWFNPNPHAIKKHICDPCRYRMKEAEKEYHNSKHIR